MYPVWAPLTQAPLTKSWLQSALHASAVRLRRATAPTKPAQLNKGRAVPAASLAPYRKPGRPKKGERRGAGKDDEESGGGGGGGSGRRPAKRTRVVGSVDEEATESVSDGAGWEQRGPDLELQVC